MNTILNKINDTKDVRKLTSKEKEKLSKEIREFLVDNISKTGGHLASNLGVVELTIALHSIFDTPKDKIIWDVGHQSYVHKILTGRKDKFDNLRQFGGIAGFPKSVESPYDAFNTGHSSTSISVGLGMAKARDVRNENYEIISVIGDGALTGGMAFEALNDAGSSDSKMIIILNDNKMSISQNVGGMSKLLTKIRTKDVYIKFNLKIKNFVMKIPYLGRIIVKITRKIKEIIKSIFIPNMLFEDLGIKYLGPVNGHDIENLEYIFKKAKKMKDTVLIHVITKKGDGYKFAEENPSIFHAISSFDKNTGELIKTKTQDYSEVFGNKIVELAKHDKSIVAITAAMTEGTGLVKFKNEFPDRFFDVGIAEQHAVAMAAGMAKNGLKPIVPIYSTFYQRAFDQVIHDIAIQNLPVVLCVDRAGVVGNDGETHQGVFDLSFFSIIPNITIMAPRNFKELELMLEKAVELNKPVVIRYPRGTEENCDIKDVSHIEEGKIEVIKEGKDISIIAVGKMVSRAYKCAQELEKCGISASIINARFVKPIDKELLNICSKTKNIITIEDNILKGGFGEQLMVYLKNNNIDVNIKTMGYPDKFITHGNTNIIEKTYGLDLDSLILCAKEMIK